MKIRTPLFFRLTNHFNSLALLIVLFSFPAKTQEDFLLLFNLKLERHSLEAALNLSPSQLINYIESHGVEVTPPTGAWAQRFQDHSILGKYISPYGFEAQVKHPQIILSNYNDKWTMIHEFVHFLLDQKRHLENKNNDSEIFENHRNAREDYIEESSRGFPSKEQQIASFTNYFNLEIKVLKLLSLEEISIESLLLELFQQNQIEGLTNHQARTAANYLKSNTNRASAQLESFERIASDLKIGANQSELQTLVLLENKMAEVKRDLRMALSRF